MYRQAPDELLQPVVGARVEFDDVAALLEQRDEREEQRAVQSVLVEIGGSDVGGRDDDHAGGKECGKEPPEDHRVGDVAHREFVEAEERRLTREFRRDRRDRVVARHFAPLVRLTPAVQAGVHVGHEAVEVRAAFARHVGGVEEEIHQHRLAPPDRAVDIEAARRLRRLDPHEARKSAWPRLGPVAAKLRGQRVQPVGDGRLRRVEFEAMVEDERAVLLGDGGHRNAVNEAIPAAAATGSRLLC